MYKMTESVDSEACITRLPRRPGDPIDEEKDNHDLTRDTWDEDSWDSESASSVGGI